MRDAIIHPFKGIDGEERAESHAFEKRIDAAAESVGKVMCALVFAPELTVETFVHLHAGLDGCGWPSLFGRRVKARLKRLFEEQERGWYRGFFDEKLENSSR